ncbi:MAG: peptidoglycan-associated lipoprotein Pal [Gammaproteobacteria bacterium]|nr:MAG: peptidoglycan-associated lipoprotein Pal [Gammaproteobacteria bacterium]
MKKKMQLWLIVPSLALVLGACEGTMGTKDEGAAGVQEGGTIIQGGSADPARARGIAGVRQFTVHPLDDPSNLLSKRTVYFDFDSAQISSEAQQIIEAHAKYLANNSSAMATLEGHADERGTREYNLALGERRANAVLRLVGLQGASQRQMEAVSYGEENPVAFGHDESSWRQNRRVEILYTVR